MEACGKNTLWHLPGSADSGILLQRAWCSGANMAVLPLLPALHVRQAGDAKRKHGLRAAFDLRGCVGAAQDFGFREGDHVRRIPFEVMVKGDKAPFYEETLEDAGRFNDEPVLPFNAYGTMALARSEFEANSGSSQVFWLLKVPLGPVPLAIPCFCFLPLLFQHVLQSRWCSVQRLPSP